MKTRFGIIAAALAPLAGAAFAQSKVEVLWLGQSAMRITTPTGKVIMVDPFILGNPKTPPAWKNLDAVGKLDLILVTHGHGDHYADAPALAQKNDVAFWGPAGLNQSVITLGILPAALSQRFGKGGSIEPPLPKRCERAAGRMPSVITLWFNPAGPQNATLFFCASAGASA